jgi:hypothetical protein
MRWSSAAARELGVTERRVRYKIQNLNIDYETLFKKSRRRKTQTLNPPLQP